MEKICVQRKVEVWVEDFYIVEEINDETIEAAINYDLDPDESDILWETQIDLGPVEVYDQHNKKIYSNIKYDE
jgi:hypothetical protein